MISSLETTQDQMQLSLQEEMHQVVMRALLVMQLEVLEMSQAMLHRMPQPLEMRALPHRMPQAAPKAAMQS